MIRRAREKDLPEIGSIYNETIPSRLATADVRPVSIADRRDWFAEHDDQRPIFVYEDEARPLGQRILGWVSFSNFYGRPAYQSTIEISVYVSQLARRKGLGRELMSHSFEKARTLKIQTLLAFIFSHNQASIDFFAKAGFKEWGRLPRVAQMDGTKYDLSIYGIELQS